MYVIPFGCLPLLTMSQPHVDDYEVTEEDLQLRGAVPNNPNWGEWKSWILINAPVKSGTTKRRYLLQAFWIDAWEAYRIATPNGVGYKLFRVWCSLAFVNRAVFDRYLCQICYDQRVRDAQGLDKTEEYLQHRMDVDTQCSAYRHHLTLIGPTRRMIIFDYGRFHESAAFKWSTLCFARLNSEVDENGDNIIVADYLHYLSPDKQNSAYIYAALLQVVHDMDFTGVEIVEFWADSGERCYGTLFAFAMLQDELSKKYKGLKVQVNFYAPRHGHSRADGAIGAAKKKLRANLAGSIMSSADDIINAIWCVKNSFARELTVNQAYHQDFKSWPEGQGVSKFLCFQFPGDYDVECYQYTAPGKSIIQELTPK